MAEQALGQYLAEALEREWEERRKNRNELFLRASEFPLEKSLASFDREKVAAKVKCSAQRFLGRRLSRSNRECADFGKPGFPKALAIWNIASTAKTTKAATWVISTSTTEGLEKGWVPSTTLPQNVALRPSMSEFV